MATKSKTKAVSAVPALSGRYIEGIGRRKTAVARVRLFKGEGKIFVGDRALKDYFQVPRLRDAVMAPFTRLKIDNFDVIAKVQGGGAQEVGSEEGPPVPAVGEALKTCHAPRPYFARADRGHFYRPHRGRGF